MSNTSFWVRKEKEVMDLNLRAFCVVSWMFSRDPWQKVKQASEGYLQSKVLTNLFMVDKALVKIDDSFSEMKFYGKCTSIGNLHLKIEKLKIGLVQIIFIQRSLKVILLNIWLLRS